MLVPPTKVLVVNDNVASLLAINSLLDQWSAQLNYTVFSATSGQDALRHVLRHDFAVILLDVNMPGMDGYETAEAIRSRPRTAEVPIIFVTAFQADELDRLKAFRLGAADFLFTPLIPQILRAKIQVFAVLAARNAELSDQSDALRQRETELTAANAALNIEISERREAERQSRAKDEFLAMLGHELRTPLSAIGSAATLLAMHQTSASAGDRAREIVLRQTRHLRAIVDDLLDLTRATSGEISLDTALVDMTGVVHLCLETFRATGRAKGYHITFDGQAEHWVPGDAARLEQVVSNLLDNALKYTPAGGAILITLAQEGQQVVLRMRDSGIGIQAELLPVLFDVFVQGASSVEHGQGGLGVGLALVKRLVQLHGGEITVHSDGADLGSQFQVSLPCAPALAAPCDTQATVSAAHHARVLLVEDNDDGREMMAMLLEASGFSVQQAADGTRGVAAALADPPDVALIDIGLPGIDGYEVARQLRAHPDTACVRLIALTGYGLEEDRQRVLAAGFDLHLIKPIAPEQLLAALGAGSAADEVALANLRA